ncbi:PepSY domain-containing protein [Isoptericola jiangsuensis]|uniref:PepSY domain-containing protein n=1 Tax=Isoptericola jiangsuensis TaxID=548579 RepID=UPI003AAB6FB4
MTHRTARLAGATALVLTLGVTLTACSDSAEEPEATAGVEVTPSDPASPEASADADDDGAGAMDGASDDPSAGSSPDAADDGAGAMGDPTTHALQAVATAEAEAGGTAYAVDLDDTGDVWEVDVAVDGGSVEVTVDSTADEVQRTENDDLDPEDRDALDAAKVGLSEAIQRVVGESGGTLDDAELDVEDGTARWSVTVVGDDGVEQDHLVDTATGETGLDTDD